MSKLTFVEKPATDHKLKILADDKGNLIRVTPKGHEYFLIEVQMINRKAGQQGRRVLKLINAAVLPMVFDDICDYLDKANIFDERAENYVTTDQDREKKYFYALPNNDVLVGAIVVVELGEPYYLLDKDQKILQKLDNSGPAIVNNITLFHCECESVMALANFELQRMKPVAGQADGSDDLGDDATTASNTNNNPPATSRRGRG